MNYLKFVPQLEQKPPMPGISSIFIRDSLVGVRSILNYIENWLY